MKAAAACSIARAIGQGCDLEASHEEGKGSQTEVQEGHQESGKQAPQWVAEETNCAEIDASSQG